MPDGDGYPLYAGEDGVGIAGNLDGSGHRAVSIMLVVGDGEDALPWISARRLAPGQALPLGAVPVRRRTRYG